MHWRKFYRQTITNFWADLENLYFSQRYTELLLELVSNIHDFVHADENDLYRLKVCHRHVHNIFQWQVTLWLEFSFYSKTKCSLFANFWILDENSTFVLSQEPAKMTEYVSRTKAADEFWFTSFRLKYKNKFFQIHLSHNFWDLE